jgi:hypothetical protein
VRPGLRDGRASPVDVVFTQLAGRPALLAGVRLAVLLAGVYRVD